MPNLHDTESQWLKDWIKKEHEAKKYCLANLLPISGSLNASVQNEDCVEKSTRYADDSALKAPREFAKQFDSWTPSDFENGAEELAEWALKRWEY